MKIFTKTKAKKWCVLALASMALSACGTTSLGANGHGANISYKFDKGIYKTANVTRPLSKPRSQLPQSRKLKKREIDTALYAHQKVGRPYTIMGKRYTPKHEPYYDAVGTASWYGAKFNGKPTATGEIFNMNDITAAHKTMALNSMVRVTNLETGATLMVRVNDRGPFVDGRIIDLSRASAQTLGLFNSGLARVRVQYVGPADPAAAKKKRRKSAPLYVKPRPKKHRPAPKYVAEAPTYIPLRKFSAPPAAPVAQQPSPYSRPQGAQLPNREPEGDGPITLTIKGPIHMASSKSDDALKPKFIPAVNYTVIKTPDTQK